MTERIFHLTDREALLAKEEKLKAVVRAMKPQPPEHHWQRLPGYKEYFALINCTDGYWARLYRYIPGNSTQDFDVRCPFGAPGTVLAGKETWAEALDFGHCTGQYFVMSTYINGGPFDNVRKWHPPVTMPREAIRHRFTVKSVRVMQGRDISIPDAIDILGIPWSGEQDRDLDACQGCTDERPDFWLRDRWNKENPRHWFDYTWFWLAELEVLCPQK